MLSTWINKHKIKLLIFIDYDIAFIKFKSEYIVT